MTKILIVALLIFLVVALVLWKTTSGPIKKEYGEKMWRQGASRLSYWQFIIYVSGGITFLLVFLLKTANILSI